MGNCKPQPSLDRREHRDRRSPHDGGAHDVEHSARLLRPQSAQSTLRLLLLDEANRLDRANLGMLFDLCSNLDLQLLVAAPEVAQAKGNTTYRLVRVPDGNQGEEVRVTGRRMVAEEAA